MPWAAMAMIWPAASTVVAIYTPHPAKIMPETASPVAPLPLLPLCL